MALVEKRFDTGEVVLNYAEGPDSGPPLLLLHGTGNRWQAFLRHIPPLSQRWHVYAPDYRGHGGSGRADTYGFGSYYRDTVAFMEAVVREPSVVFGHSLGGRLALKIAAEHPSGTRAIILGDSSLATPRPSGRMGGAFKGLLEVLEEAAGVNEIYQALRRRSGDSFDPVGTLNRAKNLSMVDPEMMRSIMDNPDPASPGSHFHGYSPEEHLQRVRCPVLILQAGMGMLSDDEVQRALDVLPEAYHVRLEGMPHEFLTRETEPVVDAVTSFLESLR